MRAGSGRLPTAGRRVGCPWVIWGVAVRTVFVYHGTWFVNSAAHTWGYRNYPTNDNSTNLWWVALLSFGEGWHNNHHGDQRAASHGRRWFELDPTYWTIRLLSFGWACTRYRSRIASDLSLVCCDAFCSFQMVVFLVPVPN